VGIISWLLFGLLAGAVARVFVPGRQGIGCIATLAVGLVGALIGGVLGEIVLGDDDATFRWDLGPFLLAVAGSIVLLLALQAFGDRRRS
jgi:uncharacterized membrane protein YeaQ/YmgE (transglycosylase-associated protein family)